MKDIKPTKTWGISLLAGGLCSLIVILTRAAEIQIPDWASRALGVIILISLPVMVFTSIKMYKNAKDE